MVEKSQVVVNTLPMHPSESIALLSAIVILASIAGLSRAAVRDLVLIMHFIIYLTFQT